jgi:LysM repeat protein
MASRTHTVVKGDTLSKIARRYYGDMMLYRPLAEVNKIANPDLIHPGQVIALPARLVSPRKGTAGGAEGQLELTCAPLAGGKKLVLEAKAATAAPFSRFPLGADAVTIHYELSGADSTLAGGSFPFNAASGATHEVVLSEEQHAQIAAIALWAEPYGYAALVVAGPDARGQGRVRADITPADGDTYSFQVMQGVVRFIVDEMNTNKRNPDVPKWAGWNAGNLALRLAAKAGWATMVATGRPWDHKPRISPIWGAYTRLGNSDDVYFYDIYSNIHYGYVGRAAGFTLQELWDGADAQQKVDHGTPDDPTDVESIEAGFNALSAGTDITIDDVLGMIRAHPNWEKSRRAM